MASFERVRRNMTSNAVLAKTNNRQFSIRRDPSIQVRSVSEVPNGVVVEGGGGNHSILHIIHSNIPDVDGAVTNKPGHDLFKLTHVGIAL